MTVFSDSSYKTGNFTFNAFKSKISGILISMALISSNAQNSTSLLLTEVSIT